MFCQHSMDFWTPHLGQCRGGGRFEKTKNNRKVTKWTTQMSKLNSMGEYEKKFSVFLLFENKIVFKCYEEILDQGSRTAVYSVFEKILV